MYYHTVMLWGNRGWMLAYRKVEQVTTGQRKRRNSFQGLQWLPAFWGYTSVFCMSLFEVWVFFFFLESNFVYSAGVRPPLNTFSLNWRKTGWCVDCFSITCKIYDDIYWKVSPRAKEQETVLKTYDWMAFFEHFCYIINKFSSQCWFLSSSGILSY